MNAYSNANKLTLRMVVQAFNFLALTSLVACAGNRQTDAPYADPFVATKSATPSATLPTALKIVDKPVEDFGWTADGEIYFSFASDAGVSWHQFDVDTTTLQEIEIPYSDRAVTINHLEEGGDNKVLEVSMSPSGQTILYAQLPKNYATPTPPPESGPVANAAAATELWLANTGMPSRRKLDDRVLQGCSLSSKSIWRLHDTRVLGWCFPLYGFPKMYFLVDTEENTVHDLLFGEPTDQVVAIQADLSYDAQWLAFRDAKSQLWIVSAIDLERQKREGLDQADRIELPHVVLSPMWSSDDQWVYYWRKSISQLNLKNYSLSLERFNRITNVTQPVLAEQDLSSLFGGLWYEQVSASFDSSLPPNWRLSPNRDAILLAIDNSVRAPPGLWYIQLMP